MLNKCFFVVIKRHAFIVESSFKNGSQSFTVPSLFYLYKNRDSWYDETELFCGEDTILMRTHLFLLRFKKGSQSQFSLAPSLVLK